jgi:hypothetical protein
VSYDELFSRITEFADRFQRSAPQLGVAFARVAAFGDDGYTLEYRSGSHTSTVHSGPAHVASFAGGSGRGAYFMPEVDDEVVVGFEMGDINRPVILGSVWGNLNAAPSGVDTSSSNNIRTIRSRSGHEITFDDSSAPKILIKTQGGLEISLEDGPPSKISIKSIATGTVQVAASHLMLDGVNWYHIHPTGSGPTEGPQSHPAAQVK